MTDRLPAGFTKVWDRR